MAILKATELRCFKILALSVNTGEKILIRFREHGSASGLIESPTLP